VTAVGHEPQVLPELLEFMDSRGIYYEVLDGCVVVTPPATFGHEDVAGSVFAQLWAAAPAELAVLGSHFGFWYDDPSYVMPDITVARRADCDPDGTRVAPLLVVEVLSPTTRRRDLLGKKSLYAEAGVPSYWIVEPEEPSLIVLTMSGGDYVETGHVRGNEELTVAEPFPCTLRLRK
jgi:Uma2 family endonuclease